jgi:aminopeptidase N
MAAQARAALPGVDSKLIEWSALVDTNTVPNTVLRSAAAGIVHPATRDDLTEFVGRYFDMIVRVWHDRTFQIASYLIELLYPTPLASVELRDTTRQWLADNVEAPAALRRIVAENLADVERALTAQARDAEDD